MVPAASVARAYFPTDHGGPYHRGAFELVGAPELNFEEIAENTTDSGVVPPEAGVAVFEGACIYAGGAIFKPGQWVVAESLINTVPDEQMDRMRRIGADAVETDFDAAPIWRRVGQRPHVLLKQTYDLNYGHWLVEGLPRVALVAEHFDLRDCTFIVSDRHGPAMAAVYRDSLRSFGIAARQVRPVAFRAVRVPHMIYPLPMTVHPWVKAPRISAILGDIGRRAQRRHLGPECIFVSRAASGTRRLLNESAIMDVVAAAGFTIIDPGRMTFDEQVETFCNARLIVGTYGAALTNVVFAPRGVTLFSLTPMGAAVNFYYDLMAQMGGRYISLHGREPAEQSSLNADFSIDVDVFTRLLRRVLR